MTADMATELRPHGVTVVSLYPGLVRTEKVMQEAAWLDLSNSESPEFLGRAVAALAVPARVLLRNSFRRLGPGCWKGGRYSALRPDFEPGIDSDLS